MFCFSFYFFVLRVRFHNKYIYIGTVDNHGNHGNRDFRQMPYFAKMPCFLPKCRSFTFSQEYFVFNQHNLKFIV